MGRWSCRWVAIALGALAATVSGAQVPDAFTNLQLLPRDISKPELVDVMRGWAGGLGVRCAHCHVGPDDLRGMDFASDEKASKRTARRMLEMTRRINGELLASLPTVVAAGRSSAHEITCFSCHRAMVTPPRPSIEELAETLARDGIDGALARFEELEREDAGRGRYDLSATLFFQLGERLADADDLTGAQKAVRFGLERTADSVNLWFLCARLELRAGDPAAARVALERILALEPDNPWAKRQLEHLDAPPPAPAE